MFRYQYYPKEPRIVPYPLATLKYSHALTSWTCADFFKLNNSLAVISTKNRDDGFRVDLGYFGHFHGTKFIGGGSQLEKCLRKLDDWITAGQVSAGAGTEARVTGSVENGRKWLSFSLIYGLLLGFNNNQGVLITI